MSYQLVKENNSSLIIITIIGSLFFFVFVLPRLEKLFYKEKQDLKEKMETVTNDNKPITKLDKNKCSKDCCAFTQWPSPHMPKMKPIMFLLILIVMVVKVVDAYV